MLHTVSLQVIWVNSYHPSILRGPRGPDPGPLAPMRAWGGRRLPLYLRCEGAKVRGYLRILRNLASLGAEFVSYDI